MTYDEWLATLLPFEAKALTRREIFQAGAASRDAEVSALEFSWAGCSQQLKDGCGEDWRI